MNKMFSSAEFVDEWNQIFSFKIKESDLGKPTETFVFNALVNYLKMFNFDTGPMIQMKNSENLVERRSFLIRFCNYIDHIYKISDKSHYFVYYDLMHPAPKKTVHMLNHLLNYFFYFNMFKDSIVPVAYGKIRQRDELLDKINKMKFENEQIEIKNKMIEKAIVDYRTMVPQTTSELNQLIDLEAAEKDSINSMEEKLSNCNSMLESLRNQEMMLAMEIVSQEEVDRLVRSKDILTNAIAEQENFESNTYANNQERTATVMKLQKTMTSIDEAMELNPAATLSAYKASILKYKELESKLTEVKQKKEELLQNHEKLVAEVKKLEEEAEAKVNELRDIKVAGRNEVSEMKLLSDSNDIQINECQHTVELLDKESEDELGIHIFIMTNASALVQLTIDCCAEPRDR